METGTAVEVPEHCPCSVAGWGANSALETGAECPGRAVLTVEGNRWILGKGDSSKGATGREVLIAGVGVNAGQRIPPCRLCVCLPLQTLVLASGENRALVTWTAVRMSLNRMNGMRLEGLMVVMNLSFVGVEATFGGISPVCLSLPKLLTILAS